MTFMDTLLPTPPMLWAVEDGEEPKGEELKGEGVWRGTAEGSDHDLETSEEGEVPNCVCVCDVNDCTCAWINSSTSSEALYPGFLVPAFVARTISTSLQATNAGQETWTQGIVE